MFGLFKRKTDIEAEASETFEPPVISSEDDARHNRVRALQRDLQLLLHARQLFPSEIRAYDDGWAEVIFSPAHPRNLNAPAVLRKLEDAGQLVVQGLGTANEDATWTVRIAFGKAPIPALSA